MNVDYLSLHVLESIESQLFLNNFELEEDVLSELRRTFPSCSEQELLGIFDLCVKIYSKTHSEKTELVITAPKSLRLKSKRIENAVSELFESASTSIILTGYSISEYVNYFLDLIVDKSQKGIYIKLFINDLEKQKDQLDRILAYRSQYLQIFDYVKSDDDKMAALHAKIISIDGKKTLISSANLSYHGMQGNIEMGLLCESKEKAEQIQSLMNELIRMKVFTIVK